MEKLPTQSATATATATATIKATNLQPDYDNWVILFDENNNKFGYTHTQKEADDICMKNSKLSWEEAKVIIKSKEKRIAEYNSLKQYTVNDF